jgi:hypothetical protein
MDKTTCTYCNTEVLIDEVEKEGGACPECGALMTGPTLFDSVSGDEYDDDFDLDDDEMEADDDFGDDFDDDDFDDEDDY